MKGFASDNYAGALPEVAAALLQANTEHARAYGADQYTAQAQARFRAWFGSPVDCHFVFNGTGANVLALSMATQSFSSILCSNVSHLYMDESTAPESLTGCRLTAIPSNEHGKITPALLAPSLVRKGDMHYAQPALVSITQSTEYGTLYTLDEIRALAEFCKLHHLYLHVDGARLLNALSALSLDCKTLFTDSGVDLVSFGGTKAGLFYGECVVVLNDQLKQTAWFKHKQSMQLASKNRFIAAQFEALLKADVGLKAAAHANAMAQLLKQGLSTINSIVITQPVEANAVFARLPFEWIAPLQAQFPFYVWDELNNEVRLMCSWDTTTQEVDAFINAIRQITTE